MKNKEGFRSFTIFVKVESFVFKPAELTPNNRNALEKDLALFLLPLLPFLPSFFVLRLMYFLSFDSGFPLPKEVWISSQLPEKPNHIPGLFLYYLLQAHSLQYLLKNVHVQLC